MTTPSNSEETIFACALEMPADKRMQYLDGACAGDERLRARVEGLLRAHAAAAEALPDATGATVFARVEEKAGDRIGHYKLLQQIGEGGCGVVYMAEQEEPVRRRVALKVIKLGMDTKAVVARFEAERQALAMMDHPNIAKVFDAGATESGRPYFVMELVRGVPITRYCDESSLPMEQRLELFAQVCSAIQHAHQKGIIHRDIKPSNILVTLHDGVPVPKVIDFGIAKATHGRLTDQTMFTAFEQFIGTPAYMSPEQAEMSGLDIDTRSDIYSLGVLLYELLAGRPPFEPKAFLQAGLDEMRRMIREVEPPKPSKRLSTLTDADRTTVAKLRGTAPGQLTTVLSGDLDWIVMRCLEKDRTRRYGTPSELAADIQRHLKNEPVTARPPSTVYLLGKLMRRHRLAVVTTASVALALVAGAGIATWQAIRATQAEKRARAQAQRSEKVAQFVTSVWGGAGAETLRGRDTTLLKELLDHAAKRLGAELSDEPETQAWLFGSLSVEYQSLNELESAEAMARRRLELLSRLHPRGNFDTVDATGALASVLIARGKLDEAEKLVSEALAEFQDGVTAAPTMRVFLQLIQADIAQARRDFVGAAKIGQEALAVHRKLATRNEDALGLARTIDSAAQHEEAVGNFTVAERLYGEALGLRRKHHAPADSELAESLRKVAFFQAARGAENEAEPLLREALAIQRRRPESTGKYVELNRLIGPLSRCMVARGDLIGAEQLCRDALGELEANCSPKLDTFGIARMNLASVLRKKGNLVGAEAVLRAELAFWNELYGADSTFSASALVRLSQVLEDSGAPEQAEALAGQAVEMMRKFQGDLIPLIGPLLHLARLQSAHGHDAAATIPLHEALAIIRGNRPVTDRYLVGCLSILADVAVKRGDRAGAERWLTEALAADRNSGYVSIESRRTLFRMGSRFYAEWAKSDPAQSERAREWRAKLEALGPKNSPP